MERMERRRAKAYAAMRRHREVHVAGEEARGIGWYIFKREAAARGIYVRGAPMAELLVFIGIAAWLGGYAGIKGAFIGGFIGALVGLIRHGWRAGGH